MPAVPLNRHVSGTALDLARVLLVNSDVASRLTLQTLLRAGGYSVDIAASASEAFGKLDAGEYELVLSDPGMESPQAGRNVLAYAKRKDYRPATALVTAWRDSKAGPSNHVMVETEDVPSLLTKVAELIGARAARRVERSLRLGSN